jgi:DNA topoisomerase-1
MANELLDTVSVDIKAGEYTFKASGFIVKFDGFTIVYQESQDGAVEKSKALPPLNNGDVLGVTKIDGNQHFTERPQDLPRRR